MEHLEERLLTAARAVAEAMPPLSGAQIAALSRIVSHARREGQRAAVSSVRPGGSAA